MSLYEFIYYFHPQDVASHFQGSPGISQIAVAYIKT